MTVTKRRNADKNRGGKSFTKKAYDAGKRAFASAAIAASLALAPACGGLERHVREDQPSDRLNDGGMERTGEVECSRSAHEITTVSRQEVSPFRSSSSIVEPGSTFEYMGFGILVGEVTDGGFEENRWTGNRIDVVVTYEGSIVASGNPGSQNLDCISVGGSVNLCADWVVTNEEIAISSEKASLTVFDYSTVTAEVFETIRMAPDSTASCADSEMESTVLEVRAEFYEGLTPLDAGSHTSIDLGSLASGSIVSVDPENRRIVLGHRAFTEVLDEGDSITDGQVTMTVDSTHIGGFNVVRSRFRLTDNNRDGEAIATIEPLPDSGYHLGYLATGEEIRTFEAGPEGSKMTYVLSTQPAVNGLEEIILMADARRITASLQDGEEVFLNGDRYRVSIGTNEEGTLITSISLTKVERVE